MNKMSTTNKNNVIKTMFVGNDSCGFKNGEIYLLKTCCANVKTYVTYQHHLCAYMIVIM